MTRISGDHLVHLDQIKRLKPDRELKRIEQPERVHHLGKIEERPVDGGNRDRVDDR